jgi:MFS family permease
MTLGTYTRLLRTRDARRLAASFLVLGMAGTMTPVALVLFVQGATGSFATASLALAGYTAGMIVASPLRGRLVDRIGPSRAVLLLALPGAATDVLSSSPGPGRRRPPCGSRWRSWPARSRHPRAPPFAASGPRPWARTATPPTR